MVLRKVVTTWGARWAALSLCVALAAAVVPAVVPAAYASPSVSITTTSGSSVSGTVNVNELNEGIVLHFSGMDDGEHLGRWNCYIDGSDVGGSQISVTGDGVFSTTVSPHFSPDSTHTIEVYAGWRIDGVDELTCIASVSVTAKGPDPEPEPDPDPESTPPEAPDEPDEGDDDKTEAPTEPEPDEKTPGGSTGNAEGSGGTGGDDASGGADGSTEADLDSDRRAHSGSAAERQTSRGNGGVAAGDDGARAPSERAQEQQTANDEELAETTSLDDLAQGGSGADARTALAASGRALGGTGADDAPSRLTGAQLAALGEVHQLSGAQYGLDEMEEVAPNALNVMILGYPLAWVVLCAALAAALPTGALLAVGAFAAAQAAAPSRLVRREVPEDASDAVSGGGAR